MFPVMVGILIKINVIQILEVECFSPIAMKLKEKKNPRYIIL